MGEIWKVGVGGRPLFWLVKSKKQVFFCMVFLLRRGFDHGDQKCEKRESGVGYVRTVLWVCGVLW